MEKIFYTVKFDTLRTIDIQGNYWKGDSDKGIILLHMMTATKESWNVFAEKLYKKGFYVLAIDERGHGESIVIRDTGGAERSISYKDFSDNEQVSKIIDVEGAYAFLIEKGVPKEHIVLAGASIGANLTLVFMEDHHEVQKGICLSPAIDYYGVRTDHAMRNIHPSQRVYLTAVKNDPYPADSAHTLQSLRPSSATLKIYDGTSGRTHGTDILVEYPQSMDELLHWLEET